MKQTLSHTRWLVMSPTVFVDNISENTILLYDTQSGINMVSHDEELINLIKILYIPINLGVVEYDVFSKNISFDTKRALNNDIICIINSEIKPINYLPILNLQKDIDKFNENGIDSRLQIIGSKLRFISGAFIRISNKRDNEDSQKVKLRNLAANQYPCPSYGGSSNSLTLDKLKLILDNLKLTSTVVIDFTYTSSFLENCSCEDLVVLLFSYKFAYRVHLYAEDYSTIVPILHSINDRINISLIIYRDRFNINERFNNQDFTPPVTCKYLIYNEQDLLLNNDVILPVWTGYNCELFSKYIWTHRSDIDEGKMDFNSIFRNQKVNSNFFGLIDIEPDGSVYSHGSKQSINNINNPDFSLVDVVIDEFKENRTWRLTRDYTNCKMCPYRYICPPISIYELQSNNTKMCHINYNEL